MYFNPLTDHQCASAHSRSTVVVAGSTVNVPRHSPTSRYARSSFDRAPSARPSSQTFRRRAACTLARSTVLRNEVLHVALTSKGRVLLL